MAEGILWKQEQDRFVVQLNNVKPKERKFIKEQFSDWNNTGHGTQKDGTEVFLYSKKAENESQIMTIVKSLPFPFVQENIKNGKIKKIKTCYDNPKLQNKLEGLTKSKSSDKIKRSRTCSRCGIVGHDMRTCKA